MALRDRNILIVGASSGIGAALARAAAEEGARFTVSARREDRLEALVQSLGSGTAIAGDASVPEDARRIVDGAADAMGGLDLVVYCAGFGVLQRLSDCDPDTWTSIYSVNVIGANLVAGAAVTRMDRGGVVAFLSSRTVEDGNAYFSSYSASKAALDQCIRTWRVEHPDRRFIRVLMGNCAPTEFSHHMGEQLLGDALGAWEKQGIPGGIMLADEVGRSMLRALAVSLDHPDIDLPELRMDARPAAGDTLSALDPTA